MSMYIGGDKIDALYVRKTLSPGDTISYNDLTDKPFIPTAVTDLSDASNYALKTDIQTYTAGTGINITNGVISNTQTSAEWGNITGVLSTQSDLQSALDSKIDGSSLATVATSGDYNDLVNKPTIPEGLPSQSGQSGKYLTTNGTTASWATLNALQNTATDVSSSINIEGTSTTNTNAVTIGKTAENNSDGGVVIGYYAKSTSQYSGGVAIGGSAHIDNAYPAVALGYNSYVNTNGGVALGSFARVTGSAGLSVGNRANTSGIQSIQIGDGLNENNYSLAVGFGVISNERKNYQLLDGTTGLIPDDRLNTTIARTSDYYTKAEVDAMIGNIEAILQRLNSGNNS